MKYCKKCLYPDTKPQLVFNENGVCSACTNSTKKEEIDWDKKREEFKKILEKYSSKDGRNYDCIIPVSGGKDSTYQAYVIKKEFGLNPLVVNFHPLDQTDIGRKNLEMMLLAKHGGGVGIGINQIRPAGAAITGSGYTVTGTINSNTLKGSY